MIFFALAALGLGASAGIFLAFRHFTRKRLPAWVAVLHGLGGATGFTLVLLIVVWQPAFQLARQALYLLIATVALGCVNLLFHVRGVRHRTSLIAMHALCAVSGVGTLLYAVLMPPTASAAQTPSAAAMSAGPATASAAAALPSPSAQSAPAAQNATAPASASGPSAMPAVPSEHSTAAAQADELSPDLHAAFSRVITFVNASAEVSPESSAEIDAVAAALTQHPDVTLVEVQGHADERGDETRNIGLTRARAQAVIEALVAKGVARQRLHSAGYGSLCPADPACRTSNAPAACHDSEHHSNDRRVVFLPLRAGKTTFRGQVTCSRATQLIPAADAAFNVTAQ